MQRTLPPKSTFSIGLALLLAVAACSDPRAPFAVSTGDATACMVDEDGDGYGLGCRLGDDCDDEDPSVDTECRVCAKPYEGCECPAGTDPVECFTQKLSDHDTLLCTNGSRFCRDGVWSACEGANVFEVPSSQLRTGSLDRALVGDGGTLPCSPCRPGCFPVRDDVAPEDGPLNTSNSSSATYAPGGGITISVGSVAAPQVIGTDSQCIAMGAPPDADCDGIADAVDEIDGANGGNVTTRATLYMDLVPGESENASITMPFHLRSADVYFLLDGSEGMAGIAAALAGVIGNGDFLAPTVSCADTDLDGVANDELQTQGIAGNVRCLLPGSELGAGWVREIPFLGPDANGVSYGDGNERLFEQRADIGSSAATLSAELSAFAVEPNHALGNAQMQGLRLLATGAESYVGWDRPALPPRIGCAAGSFGYGCFRMSALPIAVLMTAEPLHNGPGTSSGELAAGVPNAYPSEIHGQQLHAGSYAHYLPVGTTNEGFASAYNSADHMIATAALGSITDDFVTFTGNSERMAVDIAAARLGCPGLSAEGPDAVFRFSVDQRKTLSLSTEGTRFDSVLGIVRADAPITSSTPPDRTFDFPVAASGDGAPNALGSLPQGVSARVLGNSAGANANYSREVLGCYGQASFAPPDSTDFAPDVAFKFNLDSDMDLSFQVPADTSVKSLSLFQGDPKLADVDVVVPANAERVALSRDVSQSAQRLVSGYTGTGATRTGLNLSTAGLNADLSGEVFVAAGCDPGGATEASPDTTIDFTLSRPTRVRIETSGDAQGMGADFEHLLGLSRRSEAVNSIDHQVTGATNETSATAYPIPESDFAAGGWARVRGSVWNVTTSQLMAADYSQTQVGGATGCGLRGGGADGSPDAVFSFTLDQTRTVELTTENSSYRTYLSLHEGREIRSDNLNDTQATAQHLGVLNGKQWRVSGSTQVSTITNDYSPQERDATLINGTRAAPKSLGCNANSADAVFKFTLSEATDVQIDTLGSTYDTLIGVYDSRGPDHFGIDGNLYEYPAALFCNDDTTAGVVTSQLVLNGLAAGTYYVVVAGWDSSNGNYNLNVTDLRAPAASDLPLIACDSGSLPNDNERSRIVQTLSPGTYYVVLKGDASQVSPDYDYELNLREIVAPGALLACGYRNSGGPGSERAVIEEDLPSGDYSVTIRGAHAADVGSYRVLIRDVEFSPVELGCHDTKAGDAPSFSRSLSARDGNGAPIDYWLVLRGFDASRAMPANDPYAIYIRDANLGIPLAACSQAAQGTYTGTLEAGDYYAVVKGRDAADKGWYQLTMGDPTLSSTTSYTDLATYTQARDALTTNGVRVIGAQIGSDTSLSEQLSSLSSDTQAVDATNAPLVVQVSPDDPQLASTLGTKIVAAVQQLSASLHMNVGLRLDPAPSNPPKPFTFAYEAVDKAGDGCDPPVNKAHQNCEVGATPEFSVTFTNPNAPDSVPANPADPNGGYYMTLELVGDGRYVLERIPVYIVPSDVTPERPRTSYAATGSYWQDVGSPRCLAAERPTWSSLSWDAALPAGTSIAWKMCAAESKAALAACSLRTLATVTAGSACAQDADCPDGFCLGNVCQYAVGPACAANQDCGTNGLCRDATCRWTALPIDPLPALTWEDGRRYLRVQVDMQSSPDRRAAPVLYDWRVDYECQASE